jgi:hypothetical protein
MMIQPTLIDPAVLSRVTGGNDTTSASTGSPTWLGKDASRRTWDTLIPGDEFLVRSGTMLNNHRVVCSKPTWDRGAPQCATIPPFDDRR